MWTLFYLGSILKSSVPTKSMWNNICRNFDQLQHLKFKNFKTVGFKHSAYSGYTHGELTKEIKGMDKIYL